MTHDQAFLEYRNLMFFVRILANIGLVSPLTTAAVWSKLQVDI